MTRTPRESLYSKALARYEVEREEAHEEFRRKDDEAWSRYLTRADEIAKSQPVRLPGDANG